MELRETGKAGAAAVLLWPDDGLTPPYLPRSSARWKKIPPRARSRVCAGGTPDARVAAVESALLAGYEGRHLGRLGCAAEEVRFSRFLQRARCACAPVAGRRGGCPRRGCGNFPVRSSTGKAARIRARENRGRHCNGAFRLRRARSRKLKAAGRRIHPAGYYDKAAF